MNEIEIFVHKLIEVASKLQEKDLDDPKISGLLGQLLHILKPEAPKLDSGLVDQLKSIEDKKQVFQAAVESLGVSDIRDLKTIAHSLHEEGLLGEPDFPLPVDYEKDEEDSEEEVPEETDTKEEAGLKISDFFKKESKSDKKKKKVAHPVPDHIDFSQFEHGDYWKKMFRDGKITIKD